MSQNRPCILQGSMHPLISSHLPPSAYEYHEAFIPVLNHPCSQTAWLGELRFQGRGEPSDFTSFPRSQARLLCFLFLSFSLFFLLCWGWFLGNKQQKANREATLTRIHSPVVPIGKTWPRNATPKIQSALFPSSANNAILRSSLPVMAYERNGHEPARSRWHPGEPTAPEPSSRDTYIEK
ncbi:hypothetical protein F4861DRAFT_422044 [Xylaria intraflava]|nr:hypothetical protein F4861DRAFT_422044 [Xylaria intraflava]